MGTAVTGELIPLLDDNGSGQYIKGRNNSRDIRVGLLAGLFAGDGQGSARTGVLTANGATALNDLQVLPQASPNNTVIVKRGRAVIGRTGQGAYLFVNESDLTVTMPAASTINPRYDIVCAAAYDKGNFPADAFHGPQIEVVSGAVGASPTVPPVPAGMIKLADVFRAVNDNTISTEITERRVFTTTTGGIRQAIIGTGEFLTDSPMVPGEYRDIGTELQRASNGVATWQTVALLGTNAGSARYEQTVIQSNIPVSTTTTVNYNNPIFTSPDVSNTGGVLTLNRTGLWSIKAGFCCTGAGTGERLLSIATSSPVINIARDVDHPNTDNHSFLSTTCDYRFTAGQTVWATFSQAGSGPLNSRADPATFISATWIRP